MFMILASAGLTFMSVNALPIFSKLDVQSLATSETGAAVCMPQLAAAVAHGQQGFYEIN